MKTYDIAICGAGLVGVCLAVALAKHTSYRIALFDAKDQPSLVPKHGLDTRTLALNACSQQLLQELDLWPKLAEFATAITSIQISTRGRFAKSFLTAAEVRTKALGYVIEIHDLQRVLYQQLAALHPRIDIFYHTRLNDFQPHAESVELHLQQAAQAITLTCDWLVAADSSQSTIRHQLGIATRQHNYQQSAMVSVVQLAQSADGQAFERFLPDGVLAILPLTHNRCGTVWVMPQQQIPAHLQLSDQAYLQALQRQFGYQLGALQQLGPRQHYPLHLTLAEQVMVGRTFVIGNAAHTVNPIGAQGLNLGLHDVVCLQEFFTQGLTASQVQEKMRQRNHAIAQFSDTTARLFALDCPIVNQARDCSLLTLEHCPPLKQYFTRRMMGY